MLPLIALAFVAAGGLRVSAQSTACATRQPSNAASGFMFDIDLAGSLSVASLVVPVEAAAVDVSLFTKLGSYLGSERSGVNWTLAANCVSCLKLGERNMLESFGALVPLSAGFVSVPLVSNLVLTPGRHAFAMVTSGSIYYNNDPTPFASSPPLTVLSGVGVTSVTMSTGPFRTSSSLTPGRMFVGCFADFIVQAEELAVGRSSTEDTSSEAIIPIIIMSAIVLILLVGAVTIFIKSRSAKQASGQLAGHVAGKALSLDDETSDEEVQLATSMNDPVGVDGKESSETRTSADEAPQKSVERVPYRAPSFSSSLSASVSSSEFSDDAALGDDAL